MLSLYQVSEIIPKCYLNVAPCKTKGVLAVVYISEINDVEMSFYHECNVNVIDGKVSDIVLSDVNDKTSLYSRNVIGVGGDTDGRVYLNDNDFSDDKNQLLYHVFCDLFRVDEDNLIISYRK